MQYLCTVIQQFLEDFHYI